MGFVVTGSGLAIVLCAALLLVYAHARVTARRIRASHHEPQAPKRPNRHLR